MKKLVFLLLAFPIISWAQSDSLKPIEIELIPRYGLFNRDARVQYMYDGKEIRQVKDFQKYIRALGDENANDEFNEYILGRQIDIPLYTVGIVTTVSGTMGLIIAAATDPSGRSATYRAGGLIQKSYGFNRGTGGLIAAAIGITVASWGYVLYTSGDHLRQAVRYYNRAIRQRRVTWELTPIATPFSGGIRLVGRF